MTGENCGSLPQQGHWWTNASKPHATKKGMSQQRVNHEELIVHPQLDSSEGSLLTVPRKTTTQRRCCMLSDVAREDPNDKER